ncbi:hypothetical protein D9753_31075 [Streptomyces dangxiongensis]|uniref:Uncharacterized protein n=1 Tax=Streptomyces dangxiongensis TaxID=1442032 RepID=A0A3G2JJQ6_9ACTN|nr:hypothetical protein D9753_31075 [Streptomyces dangxiongensis]
MLAAFVRAGGDDQRVDTWLEARDRIAAADSAVSAAASSPGSGPGAEPEPEDGATARPRTEEFTTPRSRRTKRPAVALATALVIPPLALAAWALLPDDSTDTGAPTPPAVASRAPADGWVTIHPAAAPHLCLTDGRDRDGAYASAVAVQLPCARATMPRQAYACCDGRFRRRRTAA